MTADYKVHGTVAVITLNNPPVNGLGYATRLALTNGLAQANGDGAVKAIVIPKDGGADPEALIAWCRERLANYKVPKSVDFVDAFPLVPSGKVSKKDLRAKYWGNEGRGVA